MVKRTVNAGNEEPESKSFILPSEKEHLLQVVEIYTIQDKIGVKLGLDDNTVILKLEVVGGEEEGRSMLQRISLDPTFKGFFSTRLFLKAIGESYKGDIQLDTDMWAGTQFYATIAHTESKGKKYANISEYNFEKRVEQVSLPKRETNQEEVAWDG